MAQAPSPRCIRTRCTPAPAPGCASRPRPRPDGGLGNRHPEGEGASLHGASVIHPLGKRLSVQCCAWLRLKPFVTDAAVTSHFFYSQSVKKLLKRGLTMNLGAGSQGDLG